MPQEGGQTPIVLLCREHVAWVRCFRGIGATVAMVIVYELHGFERLDSPRALAAYLGLVPFLQGASRLWSPTINADVGRRPRRASRIARAAPWRRGRARSLSSKPRRGAGRIEATYR